MDQASVAEHYNQRRDEGRVGRKTSRIIRLRNLNNWTKSVLVALHMRPGYSVLDLACGKGGDLQKFVRGSASRWIGVDHARVSLAQALERYNALPPAQRVFPAKLYCGDAFAVDLDTHLEAGVRFNLVSCQFAVHYAFESEARARQMLRNVTCRLEKGGFFVGTTPDSNVLVSKLRAAPGWWFGNSVFRVVFDALDDGGDDDGDERKRRRRERQTEKSGADGNGPASTAPAAPEDEQFVAPERKRFRASRGQFGTRYRFTLDQNVDDCPEFLVHFPSFAKLAREQFGLRLLLRMNFHDFFAMYAQGSDAPAEFRDLVRRMNVLDPESGTISPDEWDAAYLYTVFAFQKVADVGAEEEEEEEAMVPPWPGLPDADLPAEARSALDPERDIVDME